ELLGHAEAEFWPRISQEGLIPFVDNAIAVDVLIPDVSHIDAIFRRWQAVSVVIHRHRASLDFFNRLEDPIILVAIEEPRRKAYHRPLGKIVHIPSCTIYKGCLAEEFGHLGFKTGNV